VGPLSALLEISRDLTASLAAEDRYARLLGAVRSVIPCDAACLLRLSGDELVPLAGYGLSDEALVRTYPRAEHPRLDLILRSDDPVRFAPDSPLPDPFDGLLASDPRALEHIHACLGCALHDGGEVIGALTADALEPHAFDDLDERVLATLGALAGAAVRTSALIEALERRAERNGAVARALTEDASAARGGQLLGTSQAMQSLRKEIGLVARSDLAVLITGETGVGKELVAREVHAGSERAREPFIQVNCAALPASIAESELFGHVAGAFTGAATNRAGKFEIAEGGTLFLDEVGELPPSLQPKLLRALQQGEIQRVGSDAVRHVDVRVVAATNRDLDAAVAKGAFRGDLYHRLAVFPIHVPALRERRGDIALLAAHFLDMNRRRLGCGALRLSAAARERLAAAPWPGNVRELENVVSRGALRASSRARSGGAIVVDVDDLDLEPLAEPSEASAVAPRRALDAGSRDALPLRERVEAFQRSEVEAALDASGGSWAAAARRLGMHRSNLHRLATRLGLR
jgi:anaerobic nitric oxide reductase transcription regulator